MLKLSSETISLFKEQDVVLFRNRLKEVAVRIGMSLVNQTKLITAASELARNMLKYAGGGNVDVEIVSKRALTGILLRFTDEGPGIVDINLAMRDGYTTGNSLGLGLPGAKRLSNEFEITSEPGKGTTVTIIRWKNGV